MKKLFAVLTLFLVLGISVNAQTRPMRVGGQVGIGLPLGSFSDAFSTGFSFNGLFIYNLQPQLDLTGSLGYMKLGAKSVEGIASAEAKWSAVPLLVGARYSFPGGSSFTPYVTGELGLFFASVSSTVTIDGFGGFGGGTYSASASETDFAFVPGGGFTYPISPNLLLDVNAKFNFILSGGTGTIIGVNAGVTYGL
ncbi:MAG: outer membrane protein [Bacillota bacterium]